MRIGLMIENFNPRSGGAEQWTWQFARALLHRGHEVHVVAQSFAPATAALPITAHPLGRRRSRLDLAAAAAAKLHGLSLDVIHDMGGGWFCDVFQPHGGSRRAALEQNLQLVPRWARGWKRAAWPWLPRYREFETLQARQYVDDGRLVVALSQRVADDFRRLHRVPAGRIRLVYNGVDVQRFTPAHRRRHRGVVRARLGLQPQRTMFLIVAHNFRLKGVPALLEATARLAQAGHDLQLVVAGGKRLGPWMRAAARRGVADRVTFTGPVDDPVPLYAAADVYVQPTFYDPCSLVVLEALASGLPSITSRNNGVSELMTDGADGLVLDDPADAGALAAAMERLLDPHQRHAMGEAARQLALEHTFEHNVRDMLAVYGEAFQAQRRAA